MSGITSGEGGGASSGAGSDDTGAGAAVLVAIGGASALAYVGGGVIPVREELAAMDRDAGFRPALLVLPAMTHELTTPSASAVTGQRMCRVREAGIGAKVLYRSLR